MPNNPFYKSRFWVNLREQRLELDAHRCVVPGCTERGCVVDHIETRPPNAPYPTPADRIDNLRTLCRTHDAQVKEQRVGGARKQGGRFRVKGCDASGQSLDPSHPWKAPHRG